MTNNEIEFFPLSKNREIVGSRRLVREKILQVLIAFEQSGSELDFLYSGIFFREFTFDAIDTVDGKLLTPNEITELDADIPIKWKNEDIDFARLILNSCIELKTFTNDLISSEVENWELDRLALIDRSLIIMATAEFLRCPTVPTKVTINEILDIAKKYSTDKSHLFINGILDSFATKFKTEGLMKKTGKGLIEKSK